MSDTNPIPMVPPQYDTMAPPTVGASYDGDFGVQVTRLTGALVTEDASNPPAKLTAIYNEYSTMSPFNCNNTRLILMHTSYYGLYSGDGKFLGTLPLEINSSSEPRWSRTNPVELFYHTGNVLKSYNVDFDAAQFIRVFTEYATIYGEGESEIGEDGDHFVFRGDGHEVFVYEMSSDTKGPTLDTTGHPLDSLYLTPDNNVLISWLGDTGPGEYQGMWLFDRAMKRRYQIANCNAHKCVCRDLDGSEVLLWTNSNEKGPNPTWPNEIIKSRLDRAGDSEGARAGLVSFPWVEAVHMTAPTRGGVVFIDTEVSPTASEWPVYANEIVQVSLDGSGVRRLAHHRSRLWSYPAEPKVACSRHPSPDGKYRLVFDSNFGVATPPGYCDEYLLAVPGGVGAIPSRPGGTRNSRGSGTPSGSSGITR